MNLLEVNSIYKTYGAGETAVNALKDVNFSVAKPANKSQYLK